MIRQYKLTIILHLINNKLTIAVTGRYKRIIGQPHIPVTKGNMAGSLW